jgi:hypothetical protein
MARNATRHMRARIVSMQIRDRIPIIKCRWVGFCEGIGSGAMVEGKGRGGFVGDIDYGFLRCVSFLGILEVGDASLS